MVMVNVWLGIPFMMVILLGGLQSIPTDLYEAAEIDGASSRQSFRHITLPLLQPVMTPAIILGVVWTFNNFNVPFVLNQNELETSDTLVTALFRAAFQYNRYGFAGAFAVDHLRDPAGLHRLLRAAQRRAEGSLRMTGGTSVPGSRPPTPPGTAQGRRRGPHATASASGS